MSQQKLTPPRNDPRWIEAVGRYWRSNLTIMAVLLLIWAIVGLGCGVLFADSLNKISIGGFPLGFWFAQQGSIAVFVVLIFFYAFLLNRLDKKFQEDIKDIPLKKSGGGGES